MNAEQKTCLCAYIKRLWTHSPKHIRKSNYSHCFVLFLPRVLGVVSCNRIQTRFWFSEGSNCFSCSFYNFTNNTIKPNGRQTKKLSYVYFLRIWERFDHQSISTFYGTFLLVLSFFVTSFDHFVWGFHRRHLLTPELHMFFKSLPQSLYCY